MTKNCINFYLGRLGNEDWICSCDKLDLMGEPNKGDLLWLPLDAPDNEREMYVVLQKYVAPNEISYFCKPYNNEDCEGRVWTYPDCYDGDKLYLVDIDCYDTTEDVLAECDEEDY